MAGKLLAILWFLQLPAALLACEHCIVDDDMALHQRLLHLRSLADAPELGKPSKSMIAKVKPEIREIADGMLKRTTAKARLPTIPAVLRWELIGKVTQWGLHLYERPRTAATRELLDGIIDVVAEVVEAKDFLTSEDAELAVRLNNITRLHGLLRRFADSRGAPPAVTKLLDTTAAAAQNQGAMDQASTARIMIDVANETAGPDLAELVDYAINAVSGQVQLDMAHAADLYQPVLQHLGAPPAVSQFLNTSADQIRRQAQVDPLAEHLRRCRMLADSARELSLPSGIPEVLDYLAEVSLTANATKGHFSPEEGTKVLLHINELFAKVLQQLGSPPVLTELMQRLAGPITNETAATPSEVMGLLARASRELSFPGAVAEIFEYMVELSSTGGTPDPDRVQELLARLTEQVGTPRAFVTFGRDLAVLMEEGGSDMTKFSKLLTQLLKKLGMPAVANIYAKIGHNLIFRQMMPDPLTLAAVTPSLTKVLVDLETAHSLIGDMHKKLFSPLTSMYEQAVENLTGKMPESALKSAFKHVLALARPHA